MKKTQKTKKQTNTKTMKQQTLILQEGIVSVKINQATSYPKLLHFCIFTLSKGPLFSLKEISLRI